MPLEKANLVHRRCCAEQESSAGAIGNEAEVFAEAEGGDALLEGGAAAAEKALEKSFEAEPAGDAGFHFGELSVGEFFPARSDGSVVAKAAEEELDFGEGETHFSGEADEQDTIEGVGRIAALASGAVRRSEEAEFFVVADGGGVEACALGELADFHEGFLLEKRTGLKTATTSEVPNSTTLLT
jgi:hypothetical protein